MAHIAQLTKLFVVESGRKEDASLTENNKK